jgi:hypothetical protein
MIRIEAIPVLAKEIMANLKLARRRVSRTARRQERAALATPEKITKTARRRPLTAAPTVA